MAEEKKFQPFKRKAPTELALDHFDLYYKPFYLDLWPSMRIALLTPKKYSALVNNFANVEATKERLSAQGGLDILQEARNKTILTSDGSSLDTNKDGSNVVYTGELRESLEVFEEEEQDVELLRGDESQLHSFMPVKRVLSEKKQLELEDMKQNLFINADTNNVEVPIVEDDDLNIPVHLQMFSTPRGNIEDLPKPKRDKTDMIDFMPLDAASVLPVLALDLQPDCTVLDMCAAPGIKSLIMMQTFLPKGLLCLDSKSAPLGRLCIIMRTYLPDEYLSRVSHHSKNAIHYTPEGGELFDKVLVDVPCNTDRKMLETDDNNLFSLSRKGERLQIQEIQQNLLFNGIKCCKPGGTVVYSTCTLSPPQNDGTIQRVANRLWEETDIEIVIQDTTHIAERFKDYINFFSGCRFGQQVIPNLTANFGPMYFCKIKRIK